MNRKKNKSISSGFTLIEVLVASIIICTFTASFSLLVMSGIRSVRASKEITRSISMSKSIIEEIRSVPYSDIFAYNNKTFDHGKGKITVRSIGNEISSITVKHKVELNTLRSRI